MPIFQYKAMKHDGTLMEGEVSMNSELEVQGYLKVKERFIIEINEKKVMSEGRDRQTAFA